MIVPEDPNDTDNNKQKWGAPLTDVFPRTSYTEDNKLPNAIKAAGYDIKDVKGIIMGHLHLDHAGGLEHFMGTDIPSKSLILSASTSPCTCLQPRQVYVHEEEFKHAVWACATKADAGVYLENYLNLSQLNWTTFTDTMLDLFQGLTLHLTPGHTPGLCVMQLNLETDGTFIFTSDQFHVKENHTLRQPQGWLARQHTEWFRSLNNIERLRRLFNATLVYGHDYEVADELIQKQAYFS